ncbi:MAG TPA: UPF0182 family protein, partial [Candidatus Angelobacter sp.]|nr:UPF0182 family protein [Candidatus Angelobacter sp.]
MSDPAEWPPFRRPTRVPTRPPRRPMRRLRRLLLILAAILLISIGGRTWLSYYVDALWFGSLGYSSVFWKTLRLQSFVFVFFTVATYIILYGTYLAI